MSILYKEAKKADPKKVEEVAKSLKDKIDWKTILALSGLGAAGGSIAAAGSSPKAKPKKKTKKSTEKKASVGDLVDEGMPGAVGSALLTGAVNIGNIKNPGYLKNVGIAAGAGGVGNILLNRMLSGDKEPTKPVSPTVESNYHYKTASSNIEGYLNKLASKENQAIDKAIDSFNWDDGNFKLSTEDFEKPSQKGLTKKVIRRKMKRLNQADRLTPAGKKKLKAENFNSIERNVHYK